MEMVKSGSEVGAIGGGTTSPTFSPEELHTSPDKCKTSPSSNPGTPNPRPTKIMKKESSNNNPPSSPPSVVVEVHKADGDKPPAVEGGSKEEETDSEAKSCADWAMRCRNLPPDPFQDDIDNVIGGTYISDDDGDYLVLDWSKVGDGSGPHSYLGNFDSNVDNSS